MTHPTITRPMRIDGYEFDFTCPAPVAHKDAAWQANEVARLVALVFASNGNPQGGLLHEELISQVEDAERSTRPLRTETELEGCNWPAAIADLIRLGMLQLHQGPGSVEPTPGLMELF